MPGFMVGPGLGEPVPAENVKPFYTYTWDIPFLFGDNVTIETPAVFGRDCVLPTFAVQREEVEGGSIIYKFASYVNWEDVRLTFYDIPVGGYKLADQLRVWRDSVWEPGSGLYFAEQYKKETVLRQFNMDTTETYAWRLYGSWPQSIRDGELSYTRSEVKIVDVVVVYDWADTKPYDDGGGYVPGAPDDDSAPEDE